jgi:hypothetical protein
MLQSSGRQFNVQEKNDIKKIKNKKEMRSTQKQVGYPPDRSIFDILMQIKPYRLVDGKIIFTSSGITSINNQDGALIVIDGIKSGTDSRVLNSIFTTDIAKITASTNSMDVQKYTGLNSVGVIEIYTKTGSANLLNEDNSAGKKSSSLLWEPDITTNSSGKATIRFINDKPIPVVISVAGKSKEGLFGSKTIQLSVY